MNLHYNIIHDSGKILCLVGVGFINTTLLNYFTQYRACENHRLEDILNQSQSWFNERQFLTGSASIALKQKIVQELAVFNPDYFSVVAERNRIGFNVKIGKGTYISDFNAILDDTNIGNYVTLTHHTTLSHKVTIGDYCHIGPGAYVLFASLGSGSYVSANSCFVGKSTKSISTTENCNYLINSTITKDIEVPGTYYGNRRVNYQTSLDTKID
jgi:carbonic anhydrase/acetyltransferase-like protein (isoleucine patch superfamily)